MNELIVKHNGVTYHNIYIKDGEGVASLADKRAVVSAPVVLKLMTGSWKFGDQLQFTVYNKDVKLEDRSKHNGDQRIEIFLPAYRITELIAALDKLKRKLEVRDDG